MPTRGSRSSSTPGRPGRRRNARSAYCARETAQPRKPWAASACTPLPFLPQQRYDELLWACDLNFVRGEDSFVRTQWAAKPFIWQIYPQAENAHLVKLEAFLGRHPAGAALRPFWQAWNGVGSLDWPGFAAGLADLKAPMQRWAESLRTRPDLADGLVQFCLERLK